MNEIYNQDDDNSAKRSGSVVSNPQLRRLRNHTDLMVFVTIPTSSDTEVVGDLLVTMLANQYGHAIPHHLSTTAKSVLILFQYAMLGIEDHTVTNLHRYRPWQAETATVLRHRFVSH